MQLLRAGHAPEQVSAILARMHRDVPQTQISHETIDTALDAQPRGAFRRELIACLCQRHKRRRPRSRETDRRGQICNQTSVYMRPPKVDERVIPKHWEGNLIKGARNASAVGSLVERTTLFVSLAQVNDSSAAAAVTGFSTVLNRIDSQLRRSLTYDQGKEMTPHETLAHNTRITVYFADPHSPWQRGINENTNCLLRQYLPKGADLSAYTQNELDAIACDSTPDPQVALLEVSRRVVHAG